MIAKYMSACVIALSGEVTTSNIIISFLTDFKINTALSMLLGAGGATYGYSQNSLRKKTVERLQTRNQSLEKLLDKKRSSSKLTPTGDTRPEDRI